ncbi:unnamed protein product [Heligmosomoides polygyrus]|uniref:Tudor domain-containing protein n=1 Tax=Heligmosomoides polygyrus TaxID=6339 RepID=A0A183FZG7_HELPZ|nr:unnamed protein product [Heligmosomoides polygyrus]
MKKHYDAKWQTAKSDVFRSGDRVYMKVLDGSSNSALITLIGENEEPVRVQFDHLVKVPPGVDDTPWQTVEQHGREFDRLQVPRNVSNGKRQVETEFHRAAAQPSIEKPIVHGIVAQPSIVKPIVNRTAEQQYIEPIDHRLSCTPAASSLAVTTFVTSLRLSCTPAASSLAVTTFVTSLISPVVLHHFYLYQADLARLNYVPHCREPRNQAGLEAEPPGSRSAAAELLYHEYLCQPLGIAFYLVERRTQRS